MTTPHPGGGFTPPTQPAAASGRGADLHVVLVEPEIPWNTGNAGRTCLAAGAQLHLVAPLGFSLDEREIRRAGLDYWDRVRPVIWPSLATLEAGLGGLGEPFVFSTEATRTYWDVRYPRPVTLIFGRESSGLPDDFRARYRDRQVAIPVLPGAVRSLNLSTAVGIGVLEVLRQWGNFG